jgi:peptidoglycan/LPS O-acetylase OafA/YrhL
VRSTSATLLLVVITILVTYAARSTLMVHHDISIKQYGYNWAYFSFAANMCYFALGMYAFRLSQQMDRTSFLMRRLIPTFCVVSLGTLMFAGSGDGFAFLKNEAIVWGCLFSALCLWQSASPSSWCANRVFEYLRERSYSL